MSDVDPTTTMMDPLQIVLADLDGSPPQAEADPALVILTCANCGAWMEERACKLVCRCGYFLSCSDYY